MLLELAMRIKVYEIGSKLCLYVYVYNVMTRVYIEQCM